METFDVAVVGAGIVGAACAYELASSGLRVAVVEPNTVISGSTNLGYGSLSILDETPELFALTRYGLSLWEQLVEWLPADCEYRRCGTIWIALKENQLDSAAQRCEVLNREGIHSEVLSQRQLADAEPGLRPDLAGGLFLADDGCLRAAPAAEFLLHLAANKSAQLLRQKAESIADHEVRLGDGSVLYAGIVVNAAGNDAAALTPELAIEFSKGHVLVVEPQAQCVRHHVAEISVDLENTAEGMRFEARQSDAVPNKMSEVWIGSSYQTGTEAIASQVEPRIVAQVLRRAIEWVPEIGRSKPVRSWTGLRAVTLDGLPLIGRVADREGIFVATGHDGYGATAALATAKLIADEILSRTPEIDPTPYLVDRFRGTRS